MTTPNSAIGEVVAVASASKELWVCSGPKVLILDSDRPQAMSFLVRRGVSEDVCSIAKMPGTIWAGYMDGTVCVWPRSGTDAASAPTRTFRAHGAPVTALLGLDDVVVSGDMNGSVAVWSGAAGSLLFEEKGFHRSRISSILCLSINTVSDGPSVRRTWTLCSCASGETVVALWELSVEIADAAHSDGQK
jgi:hypothetical protein